MMAAGIGSILPNIPLAADWPAPVTGPLVSLRPPTPKVCPCFHAVTPAPYHISRFRRYNRIWFVPILCPRGEKGI